MTVHLVLVSVCCCVANSSFTDLSQGEQPIETLHLGKQDNHQGGNTKNYQQVYQQTLRIQRVLSGLKTEMIFG